MITFCPHNRVPDYSPPGTDTKNPNPTADEPCILGDGDISASPDVTDEESDEDKPKTGRFIDAFAPTYAIDLVYQYEEVNAKHELLFGALDGILGDLTLNCKGFVQSIVHKNVWAGPFGLGAIRSACTYHKARMPGGIAGAAFNGRVIPRLRNKYQIMIEQTGKVGDNPDSKSMSPAEFEAYLEGLAMDLRRIFKVLKWTRWYIWNNWEDEKGVPVKRTPMTAKPSTQFD
jgi:hypothetical protein